MLTNLSLAVLLSLSGHLSPVQSKGLTVGYPWAFTNGTKTARNTALDTVGHIAQRAGFATASLPSARDTYAKMRIPLATEDSMPLKDELTRFGRQMNADLILYGSVNWHTRSIWVGTGPKTISTATVSAYVFDVEKGKNVFSRQNVEGRSDEKENGLKIAADILVVPLVTVVSGGPATPREERAVQVALAKAYRDWVHANRERERS